MFKVVFTSKQYDDLKAFRLKAQQEIQAIGERLRKIGIRCDQMEAAIHNLQNYSY